MMNPRRPKARAGVIAARAARAAAHWGGRLRNGLSLVWITAILKPRDSRNCVTCKVAVGWDMSPKQSIVSIMEHGLAGGSFSSSASDIKSNQPTTPATPALTSASMFSTRPGR
jgi:hypothetical protein